MTNAKLHIFCMTLLLSVGVVTTASAQSFPPGADQPKSQIKILGNVYGGGNLAKVDGNAEVVINKGQFAGEIFGGGNGALNNDGTIKASADITNNTSVTINGGEIIYVDTHPSKHNIYGGGNLACNVGGSTNVEMNKGMVTWYTFLSNTDAVIPAWYQWYDQAMNPNQEKTPICAVFGAGYGAHTDVAQNTNVTINIEGNSDIKPANGTAFTHAELEEIDKIIMRWMPDHRLVEQFVTSVHGGGYDGTVGAYDTEAGTINYDKTTCTSSTNVTIKGQPFIYDVFGGGLGSKDGADANGGVQSHVGTVYGGAKVDIQGGIINGDVFGGGAGIAGEAEIPNPFPGIPGETVKLPYTYAAQVLRETDVTIDGTSTVIFGSVYGGGDIANTGWYTEGARPVFEGHQAQANESKAILDYTTSLNLNGGNILGKVYGGGNGRKKSEMAMAMFVGSVTGSTNVKVNGSSIWSNIYGGGNTGCVYACETISATLPGSTARTMVSGVIDGCTNVEILGGLVAQDIFGGGFGDDPEDGEASSADVAGNTYVYFKQARLEYEKYWKQRVVATHGTMGSWGVDEPTGKFLPQRSGIHDNTDYRDSESDICHNLYGGGNMACTVKGNTHVYMVSAPTAPEGFNKTDYYNDCISNVAKPHFSAFGGGFGKKAIVANNAYSNIVLASGTGLHSIIGGGMNGPVLGSTKVHVGSDPKSIIHFVYGGGYYAPCHDTQLDITRGTILEDVFGGSVMGDINNGGALTDIATNTTIGLQEGKSVVLKDENNNTIDTYSYDATQNKITIYGNVYGGNDVSGTVNGIAQLNIYGGEMKKNVYAAGNGDHIGYYEPGIGAYYEGKNDNYYFVDHSDDKDSNGNDGPKGNTYKGRPQTTGGVALTLAGNSVEDRVKVLGQVFGGGNSCTIGQWNAELLNDTKYHGDPHLVRDDPTYFLGGGQLHITLGSHITIGRTHTELESYGKEYLNEEGENISGLYMGCSGMHLATQNTDKEDHYYHHYYDKVTAKYWPGFAVYKDDGTSLLSRAEGLESFNAYLNNILVWTDDVMLTIPDNAEDIWLANFVGGGFRGSMKAMTADGQFAYILPRGVTVGNGIVGGAYNTDVVYRIYATSDGHNYTDEEGHYKYLTTPGALTKYDKDTNPDGDYHHIEYAEDGTTPTGIIRFYYNGGVLKSNDRGDETRAGKVFREYSDNNGTFGDDNIIDFSGMTEAHGLRSHKSHALLYLDLRCQLEPEVINNSVHGGNVFGGCFASGTVEGDVWTDYRAYIAQKWYGNENFNGGPKMFSNAADYQQNFAMMAFGAGYGKNTSIKGDTYLRVIYNNENGRPTYPCLYNVFGGSYHGTVDGNANIYYNAGQQGLTVGGIYGGGSQGYVAGKTFVELAGGYIANVYGGAREANVGRGTHVWAYDGIKRPWGDDLKDHDNAPLVIERMFGGSDVSGLIGFKADATDVDDAEGRVEGTGWTAYYSTDSWPEELYVNGKDGELKRFDSYIQIGGTDHSDRGYPLVGQVFAGGNGENADTEHGQIIPGIDYALIELNDGNVMEAFGGGNAATVHKQNYILVNGMYSPIVEMVMPNPLLTQILQERVLKSAPDRYSVTGNTFTFKPYSVQRLFGGNNLASMDIQPKWNLKKGYIGSVYSGGNMGDMTYYNASPAEGETKGLSITIDSEDINIEALYGGCRMSDVRASHSDDGGTVYPVFGADEYGATVNVISGNVGNVYGGNDVSGYVYNGTNVNISGSITGNVYGAGNGDYLYGYDKDGRHEFAQDDDIIVEWDNDIKKMLYWMKGDKNATPLQQLLALNNMRPHVEKAYLNIQGESAEKKVYIHGSVYCGGNASTIRPMTDDENEAHVKFNIGDNVIVNEVFMGSNGESLKYDAHNQGNTYLVDFEKINGLNLATDDAINWSVLTADNTAIGDKELLTMNTDLRNKLYPNLLSVYMRAVDMKAMPQGFEGFSNHEFKNTWIGTFCMGGNAGSMMIDKPIDIVFPQSLNFFGRIIGGSKDASFQYKGKWHRGGFRVPLASDATLDGEPTKTKLRMKIRGNWYSRRMIIDEKYKTPVPGEAPEGDYLVYDKTDNGVDWKIDGKAWHDGCNVYGGCYLSGDMVGDVQIYIESDMLAYSDPRYSTTIDTYTNAELDESNKLNIPVANVYGAGYGPESRNYGDAYIYMKDIPHASSTTHPSVNNIYGGGRNGMLIGNSVIHVHDGLVFQDVVGGCFAAPLYGSSQVTVGYPKFYICKQTGEYFLDRADIWNEGYDTKGYKGKESVIKKSIKYFEGTYVPCNIYDRITGVKPYNNNKAGNLLELSNDNKSAYFEYHDEYTYNSSNPENFFPEGGWDNVEIRVRGGVYGGGFSLSNSTSAVAGSYTTLASTEEYNHGVDSKGNSSIGFGGNSSIIITDKGDTKNHIKISTETVREGDNPHKEYTGRGGVYGDGRLVFCEGFRTAELNGYGYAEGVDNEGNMNPLMLNSLQRLDLLTVNDCNFKLYGDQDFATDQIDARKYSLARIGELSMNSSIDATQNYSQQRNYIAFYNNIHYLGAIVTNDDFHTGLFHDATGAVGTQTYRAKKQEYIANYHGKDDQQSVEAFKQRNFATARNMVGINSGYCLRVENQYYNEKDEKGSYYGPIVGVAEVKLLNVQPGEGGGYVYADNIHADIYNGNGNEPTFMNESGNFVFEGVHRPGDAEGEKQYIVDDCLPNGFDDWMKAKAVASELPEQHYWYVIGDTYYYNTTLTGYTFSGEKTFNLINADPNVIFAGIDNGDEVSLQSVKWIPATYPDGYSGDLRSGRDADLTPLSGTDKYKFTLQVGEDAWSAVMPRTTVNDTEALPAATAWTEYTTTSSPRFNVQLIDNVNNSPSGSEEAYFNDHLSVPEKVQLVIKARKGDEIKTYNVTLEVVYLQGPSFTGNVNILNCALPGERIGFNSKDIKVKTTEHLPLTSFGWKLVPTEGDAVTIPETYYTTNAEGYVEGSIPALYSQNHWNIHYTFNAGGEEFSVTPTTDEQQPLNKRMIVVHNYHKMSDITTQYDVTLATVPDASPSGSQAIYAKALKPGAMIYLTDDADIAAFVDYINNGNTTEGMHFFLQNDFTLASVPDASASGSIFAGTLHGDGYSLTLPKRSSSLFGNNITGKVYNLGVTNGTITTAPDASASVINCFTTADNADDLRYGKKAYALSHYFTESNDESYRNGYVHTYYADNDAMGGDWRYARTASYGVEYLRKGTPNYGQALTNHNTDHAEAYTPVEHDYLFFGQALRPDAAKAYPEHINTDEVNRVYRTDGYYRSTTPDAFHYNKAAWAMQPTLTAIDFAADNATVADGSPSGFYGKTDDRPAMLTSFNSDSNASISSYSNENMGKVTQNLLVYHNEDVNIIANERPNTEEAAVIFHSIRKTDSGITTPQLHLVDKQEFCAPIAFNVTARAWYERTPSYCAENNNSAWEGICLPFTVKKVEASTNGEISHFYGEPTEAQLADPTTNDRTLHHEYWLRGLVSVASANATTTATFQRPGDAAPLFATSAQTAAAFDYMYAANSYFKDNRTNYDNGDNPWYDVAHTFTAYKPLTANTPYIVSFPGERFYEFNLTGQHITFTADGGTTVPVTEAMTTTANGYVHNGTFLRSDIGDNAYAMNADGTSFVNTSTTVEPFRTYMSVASSAANGGIIFIAAAEAQGIEFIGEHNDDSDMDDDSESYNGNGLTIYAKDRSVVVESTSDCILPCYGINGTLVGMWNIQRGTNIFNLHTGIYVIGGKKMVIR